MLTSFQRRWGIEQWVAFLKDKELPVSPESITSVAALRNESSPTHEKVSALELTKFVFADPYLSLKLLRRAEANRSHRLGQETTTPLAVILQTGLDDLVDLVMTSPTYNDTLQGCAQCASRAVMAAEIAREWAKQRIDVAPEEVAMASLLSETGELLLWHFAPEHPQKVLAELAAGRYFRPVSAQQAIVGFSFKQMTLSLVQAWNLPNAIALLIKGTDTPRANIARIAVETASHIMNDERDPLIPADVANASQMLPKAQYSAIVAALPIPDDYKSFVIETLMMARPQGDRDL